MVIISSTQSAIRVPRKRLAELIEFVAHSEGVRVGQVDLAIVASPEITGVNRRFLGHAGATDVISFDLSDKDIPGLCAQLVVCGDLAVRQAKARGLKARDELMLYVIHGLLHLMGYEDTSIRGGARMHAREEELLKEFLKNRRA
jgi:probable rRNA maturation factor